MMNNPWYRVKFRAVDAGVMFEHPTDMATGRGWMVRESEAIQAAKADVGPVVPAAVTKQLPTYTMDEVAKHDTADDLWVVLHGKVYDLSGFLDVHPGGEEALLLVAGQDATHDFDAIHGEGPKRSKEKYVIGILAASKKPHL
jgi:nitrate reductase (NAD(P)H)